MRALAASIFLRLAFSARAYAAEEIADWQALMPRAEDQTEMWWRDGFPSVVEGARWHRCIRTGNFGFVLDTETLTVPHFGSLAAGESIDQLPAAKRLLTGEPFEDLVRRANLQDGARRLFGPGCDVGEIIP